MDRRQATVETVKDVAYTASAVILVPLTAILMHAIGIIDELSRACRA